MERPSVAAQPEEHRGDAWDSGLRRAKRKSHALAASPRQQMALGRRGPPTSAGRSRSGSPMDGSPAASPGTTTSSNASQTPPAPCWRGTLPPRSWPTSTKNKGRAFLTTTDVSSREQAERELFRIEKVIHLDWSTMDDVVFSGCDPDTPTSMSTTPWPVHRCPCGKTTGMTSTRTGCRMAAASSSAATDPTRMGMLPSGPWPQQRDLWLWSTGRPTFEQLTDTPAEDEVQPQALSASSSTYRGG